MTFGQLKTACYSDLGYTAANIAANSEVDLRFGRWLNEAHRKILRDPAMSGLRQITLGFNSVASQQTYGLPLALERVDSITQTSTNRRLRYMTMDRQWLIDPGNRALGVPDFWGGPWWEFVTQQPASTGIWVASSAIGDVTQLVNFQGVRANGDVQALQQVTLNGTTRVQIQSSVTDFAWVLMWNLSLAATGTVSLYDAAVSGNELGRIPIGQTSSQYQVIRLWQIPSDVYAFVVNGVAAITDLTNATDVPLVPPSFHDVLAAYARMKEYERTKDPVRYPAAQQEFNDWTQKLYNYVEFPPDYAPIAGQAARNGYLFPNLPGGWFGADFYRG